MNKNDRGLVGAGISFALQLLLNEASFDWHAANGPTFTCNCIAEQVYAELMGMT